MLKVASLFDFEVDDHVEDLFDFGLVLEGKLISLREKTQGKLPSNFAIFPRRYYLGINDFLKYKYMYVLTS